MSGEAGGAAGKASGGLLAADTANEMAARGEIVLIDIRRPEEWAQTGIASHATPLTMHQDAQSFFLGLETAVGGDKARPIAVICATGGRTGQLVPHLRQAGYTTIYDVSEGMMGSPAGLGWLRRGLPVKAAGQ